MGREKRNTRARLEIEPEEPRRGPHPPEASEARHDRVEKTYRREHAVLNAINRVLRETLTCESVAEVAATCLAVAEGLTGSKFGFIGEINQAGRMDTIALSDPGWDACRMPKSEAGRLILDMEIRGIWGDVLEKEKTLIVNDPDSHPARVGVPEGHPPITSFLGVPLKHGSRTMGMIGLANKPSGYSRADQQAIEALSVSLVEALNRKRADEALRLDESRLEALLTLNRMAGEPLRRITDFALEGAVRLTKSTIGYLAFMNEDESVLTMHSWSKQAMKECAIIDKPLVYPVETIGLLGEAVRQRKAIITNNYAAPSPLKKGYPEGHVQIKRHLNAPIFDGERIVAVAGVGNKLEEYDESDVRQLTLLMEGMWRLLQRKRAQEELENYRRHLEILVQQRTAELAAANKELESFSYSVSHDLRAPLMSMDGFCQALLEEYGDNLDEQGRNYLSRIRGATQNMAALINHLLELSRVTRAEVRQEKVDLSAMARDIAGGLRREDPGRNVRFVVADGLVVTGDGQLLRLVLENLIGNAWKFTGKHPAATIEFGATRSGDATAYFVRDDGAGFNMAYAERLFKPFHRLHGSAEFPGSGVGLATAEKIVRRHAGRMWAEGEVEKGATFYFTLAEAPAAG